MSYFSKKTNVFVNVNNQILDSSLVNYMIPSIIEVNVNNQILDSSLVNYMIPSIIEVKYLNLKSQNFVLFYLMSKQLKKPVYMAKH